MKRTRILSNILILLFTFLCIGCKHQPSKISPTLRTAERLINTDPDSASSILKRLSSPEKLDDETFAHWCMLSGKVTDKINTPILPTFHLDRALKWYENNGTQEEQAQMKLYLGRSYVADGNYDKAMAIYIDALEIAEKNKLDNLGGYINCYMGDLYEQKYMQKQAIDKYKTGANKFKTANNVRSYACALRDVGREYALMDSLSHALKVMQKADSIAIRLDDDNVKSSITNSLGNIYQMQHEYSKAKACFIKALEQGKDKMPDRMALVKLYIETDSISQAYDLLEEAPQNDPTYTFTIKYFYSQIYEAKGNYKKALENLQEYTEITDSIVYADNQSKILEIETKYNVLKAQSEIDDLKIAKQKYIIILTVSIAFTLLILLSYHIYRKQATSKIQKQQEELNQTKFKLLDLSLELEKKRNQLETAKAKNENVDKLQEEITDLSLKHKKLQNNILTNSAIYKKLLQLAKQNMPGNDKPLITDNLWQLIMDAITVAYPNLEKLVYDLCPDLSPQEWQYCCFYMFNYDSSDEAKLLNISPSSARTKHLRLRQRLNITLEPKTTLYEYLIQSM
ncbi:tetratricopeptide repeat protein [Bacteroides ihuae]|uniref:tetratricopeptide repeat protein n=1 Tax=Bacteroides ihuae TaxID=1852362 RepID=UPI0008DAD9CD|nr:tetratricopeptide repeat protein [Bacteroides ihuae]